MRTEVAVAARSQKQRHWIRVDRAGNEINKAITAILRYLSIIPGFCIHSYRLLTPLTRQKLPSKPIPWIRAP